MLRYVLDYSKDMELKIKDRLRNGRYRGKKLSEDEVDDLFSVVKNAEENYRSALEYFILCLVMTSDSILEAIESRGQKRVWVFLAFSIFDEGVNNLWSFYDGKAEDFGNILMRYKQITNEDLSSNDPCDELQNELCKYRHNSSAHMGNGISKQQNQIHISTPYLILERLRKSQAEFWAEKLGIDNFNPSDIFSDIHKVSTEICDVLLMEDKSPEIEKEAKEKLQKYLESEL